MKLKNMHGCGNTFILVDNPDNKQFLCLEQILELHKEIDMLNIRHAERVVGQGSFIPDGFLFVMAAPDAVAMKYYDIDRQTGKATRADMCGNGIRCFSRYLHDTYGMGPDMTIMTDDGRKDVHVVGENIKVNMGLPREFCEINGKNGIYFVNSSLAHVVYLVDGFDYNNPDLMKDALKISRDTAFNKKLMKKLGHPEGLHVNFASTNRGNGHNGNNEIKAVTYEPGVGDFTSACGTGATASAYIAASVKGLDYPVTVINRGGTLKINMKEGMLNMTGPALYLPDDYANKGLSRPENKATQDGVCLR